MGHDNKTEQPTPRRRQKAREQGQVARSRELSGTLAALGALFVIASMATLTLPAWSSLFRRMLQVASSQEITTASALLHNCAVQIILWCALPMSAAWVLATSVSLAQGGLVFAPEALGFKVSRLSPAARFGQLFSLQALSNTLKALLPTIAIVYLAIALLVRDWPRWNSLLYAAPRSQAHYLMSLLFEIAWKSMLVLLLWSFADYLLTRLRLEKDLKMSREEIREEAKQTDGNPHTKGRIRRLQRQLRRSRMLKDVSKATVVITNPTHFAVALEYRVDMSAPVVLAKGRNLLAQKIKDLARWHEVPILENPPLAQALYRSAEVGQQIPVKLYTAVAEIIAFLYQMEAQRAKGKQR